MYDTFSDSQTYTLQEWFDLHEDVNYEQVDVLLVQVLKDLGQSRHGLMGNQLTCRKEEVTVIEESFLH